MGDKTFTEFQTDLTFNLGQRDDISSYVDDWINSAYIDLCTKTRFWNLKVPKRFLFPELDATDDTDTVDGTAYIATPDDCVSIYAIWDVDNDKKLTRINKRQYIVKTGREDTDEEDEPQFYVRMGTNIYLSPTPDDAYTLRTYYRKCPAIMTDGDDVTVLGAEWDEPILDLATVKSMLRLRMYEDFKMWKNEWIESVGAKMGLYESEQDDTRDILKPDIAYLGFNR